MNFAIVNRVMGNVPSYAIYLNLDDVRYMYWDEQSKKTTIMFNNKDSMQVEEQPGKILSDCMCSQNATKVKILNG